MAARFRAVFFGTPEIAVPALRALCEVAEVPGVVCQPDRPSGRGMRLRAPAVKVAARELGLPVHQPERVRSGELQRWLQEQGADVALVMAYGRILPPDVLATPRRGCLNLHASLLPKYRGAAPIQWALIEGETQTGISLMQMEEGLDTGPVFATRSLPIQEEETLGELSARLADLAAEVTRLDVPRAVAGDLEAVPQNDAEATHAPPLTRADGQLDFRQTAEQLAWRIRGLSPRPGAYGTLLRGDEPRGTLRILRARAVFRDVSEPPGKVLIRSPRVLVGTGEGLLEILEAQLEGRKALGARDLVNGRVLAEGDELALAHAPPPPAAAPDSPASSVTTGEPHD